MPTTDRKLRVFLCHSSQDKPIVRELYQRLNAEGWIDPWLDKEKLLPGQNWDIEIEKAVEAADVVIVFLSKNSISKEGYIQKEIKKILDVSAQIPEEAIFIIPLRLEECEVPRVLKKWHWEDYFPFNNRNVAYDKIIASLKQRAIVKKIETKNIISKKDLGGLQNIKKTNSPLKFDKRPVHIGLCGTAGVGKTTYLLSLYISAQVKGADWLIGFNNDAPDIRKFFMQSAHDLSKSHWPESNHPNSEPLKYSFTFFPSLSQKKIDVTKNDPLSSLVKFLTEEPNSLGKKKSGLSVDITDFGGIDLVEPIESSLWASIKTCDLIIYLIDPADIQYQIQVLNRLSEILYLKIVEDVPSRIYKGKYLPHYISVCFSKMDRAEWLPMIEFPEEVVAKISNISYINLGRQIMSYFSPDRIRFHCISSVGLGFTETGKVSPINVFAPINDWIKEKD